MKAFYCDDCGNLVFFENVQCLKCQAPLGFLPDVGDLSALESTGENLWEGRAASARNRTYRSCSNQVQYQACNWLVPVEDPNQFCASCRLNDTIPDVQDPNHRARWHKLESAKRRLLYTLMQLQLPVTAANSGKPLLRFRFLADSGGGPRILTGHSGGVITMNIAEADDGYREQQRVSFHEPYRTLLGHFRHEIAHYYWEQLIAGTANLSGFREHFGDETQDYASALTNYYQTGPAPDWPKWHVSAYASAHPWEDWAETWAHYLHIQDTVQTAASFGMRLQPKHPDAAAMSADPASIDQAERSFDRILQEWLPVTYAVNELNRGMGLPDVYPFVLAEGSRKKLRFVHRVVLQTRTPPPHRFPAGSLNAAPTAGSADRGQRR